MIDVNAEINKCWKPVIDHLADALNTWNKQGGIAMPNTIETRFAIGDNVMANTGMCEREWHGYTSKVIKAIVTTQQSEGELVVVYHMVGGDQYHECYVLSLDEFAVRAVEMAQEHLTWAIKNQCSRKSEG